MDIFKLYRNFWDFAFENPDLIRPNHISIFAFAVEHCNRLGWKKKFGLPTTMTMEAIGIKSYNTYISAFNDLVELGVLELHEKSRNQYSSNVIALSYFDKAPDKALDKAFIKHMTKQVESTLQSTDSIIIPIYNKQETNKESNFYFDEESKTPNQLYEMKLDNYIYDNPKNKNQADYTKDELELIISNKKKSLAIWCEIHSLSERNEKQKIEFIQALNKQLYLLGFNGFCDFLRQLKHYFLTQKRENYKYIVKIPKLIDTVNEKDWKVYWTKTATEEELDPEPYLPPQPDVDLDSQEFKDWEKEASVHGEWRKRQAAKMFKAGL